MPRYCVVTPEYQTGGDYYDPPEWGADVIEVEMPTKRAAVIEGVKRMLAGNYRQYKWCRDEKNDGHNPFKGVRAFLVEEDASTPE